MQYLSYNHLAFTEIYINKYIEYYTYNLIEILKIPNILFYQKKKIRI